MSGLLAYDPDRLRQLRACLAELAEARVGVGVDPLAADAVRQARALQAVAREARRRVDAVLSADPLASSASLGVLALDPAAVAVADVAHATRLGSLVASLPRSSMTPTVLHQLGLEAERFEANPRAAAAFTSALGIDGLVRLGHPVAAAVQQGDDGSRADLARVSRLFGVTAGRDPRMAASLSDELRAADRYVASLILADGRLPVSVVEAVLPGVLHGATVDPPVVPPRGPSIPALLAESLRALPELTRRLLPALPLAERRALLEGEWGDAAPAAGRLLAAATDPTSGPLAEVAAFTDWLVRCLASMPDLVDGPLGFHLGAALAPWLLDLAPLDRTTYPELPPSRLASASLGAEVLEHVTGRPGSAAVITTASDDLLRTELAAAAGDPAYEHRIQPLAVLSSSVDAWAVEGVRRAADADYAKWSASVDAIGWLAQKGAAAIPEIGQAIAVFTPQAVRLVADQLDRPAGPGTNARLADEARWRRQAAARDAAAAGLFAGALGSGALPPGTPPPPPTGAAALDACAEGCDPAHAGALDQERAARAMEDWVEAAPSDDERAARQGLRARLDAFTRGYDSRVEAER